MNVINKIVSFLLITIRPFIGPVHCTFTIGCTTYAVIQLQNRSLLPALWHISKRLFHCFLWS